MITTGFNIMDQFSESYSWAYLEVFICTDKTDFHPSSKILFSHASSSGIFDHADEHLRRYSSSSITQHTRFVFVFSTFNIGLTHCFITGYFFFKRNLMVQRFKIHRGLRVGEKEKK